MVEKHSSLTISSSLRWELSCCGWDGSDSMEARLWELAPELAWRCYAHISLQVIKPYGHTLCTILVIDRHRDSDSGDDDNGDDVI